MNFDTELIKDKNGFERALRKIQASGITDEEDICEIMARDYGHLFRELTDAGLARMKEWAILRAMAEINRESIKNNGHPKIVSFRKDGVMYHAAYKSLAPEQIEEFKRTGIIL
jgi:hypothetical protein